MLLCFSLQSCSADTARPPPKGKTSLVIVNCIIDLSSAFLPECLGLVVWCPDPSLQKNKAEGVFCRLALCSVVTSLSLWGPEPLEAGLEMPMCRLRSVTSVLGLVSRGCTGFSILTSERKLREEILGVPSRSCTVCWPCPLNERSIFIYPRLCPLARDSNLVPWSDTPYVWTASLSHTLSVRP